MSTVREKYDESPVREIRADEDTYCPECGRAWRATPDVAAGQAAPVAWWPGLLVAVGLYVMVVFGPRVWGSIQAGGTAQGRLTTVACLTAGTEQDFADCDPALARAGVALGYIWIVLGVGAIARRRLQRASGPWSSSTAMGAWAAVENVAVTFSGLPLLGGSFLLASQLIAGTPLSWPLIDRTTDRTIEIIFSAAQQAAFGFG